jgi:hypothetical protein
MITAEQVEEQLMTLSFTTVLNEFGLRRKHYHKGGELVMKWKI